MASLSSTRSTLVYLFRQVRYQSEGNPVQRASPLQPGPSLPIPKSRTWRPIHCTSVDQKLISPSFHEGLTGPPVAKWMNYRQHALTVQPRSMQGRAEADVADICFCTYTIDHYQRQTPVPGYATRPPVHAVYRMSYCVPERRRRL